MAHVISGQAESAQAEYMAQLMPRLEGLAIPLIGLAGGFACFSVFLLLLDKSPLDFMALVWKAGFSTAFSLQNTFSRVTPLLFAALCVALPARLGLVVIGGEGAIVLGGLAAGIVAITVAPLPDMSGLILMAAAAMFVAGVWMGLVGMLRVRRGVNETIASLLMAYIAIALFNHLVESVFRDPASLNKPSTAPVPDHLRIGDMPFIETHWGLLFGLAACIFSWVLIERTRIGFSARVAGDNMRAAQVQGLPVGTLVIGFMAMGGAFAGLAGFFEVSAVHGSANASLIAGIGYTGILVAFLARHNPLAIIPVAIFLAGFEASSGLIQRRMDLPDATILVFQGMVFVAVLFSETLSGRLAWFTRDYWSRG
ncbi:MAG: ABC transporter permease [Granulosicoccus sp.]